MMPRDLLEIRIRRHLRDSGEIELVQRVQLTIDAGMDRRELEGVLERHLEDLVMVLAQREAQPAADQRDRSAGARTAFPPGVEKRRGDTAPRIFVPRYPV
jgi:hypothetical protein